MRRTLRLGVGLAAVYLAVVAATMAVTGRPVLPLFDGLTPPPPYRWVNPPPGYGFNVKPERTEATVALTDAGSALAGPTGVNGQVVLNLPDRAIPPHRPDTAVKITFTPLDPTRLGPLPPGLVPDGNAYEIRMSYRPSGRAVTDLAVAGNVILSTPEPASVLVFSGDGHGWQTIETQRVGGPDAVGSAFGRAGHYVAAIPGRTTPPARPSTWLVTGRRILIVILAAALVVNLAARARQRRRAHSTRVYRGSGRSRFQWRETVASHRSSLTGITAKRLMTRCPPS